MLRLLLMAVVLCVGTLSARAELDDDCQQAKDLDVRIDSCTKVIASGKYSGENLAITYNNRGAAYYQKDQFDKAVEDYDQALQHNPDYAWAFYNRGQSLRELGQYSRAVADQSEAIRLDPSDGEYHSDRALAYQCLGEFDRAIADFEAYFKLSGSQSVKTWQEYLKQAEFYDSAIDGLYGKGTRGSLLAWMKTYKCE